MKYNVIGLIDLIVSNLPDDQSDLGTKINISLRDLLLAFMAGFFQIGLGFIKVYCLDLKNQRLKS